MIIGKEVCSVLDGLTITVGETTIPVQNNYGKKDALDLFIKKCDEKQVSKFPLVFYVTNTVNDRGRLLRCTTNIVIMTNTKPEWLSKHRTSETFDKIINPIYEKIIPLLEKSEKLFLHGDRKTRLTYEDIANYGIVNANLNQAKSSQSVVSDYIDARVINLTINYRK